MQAQAASPGPPATTSRGWRANSVRFDRGAHRFRIPLAQRFYRRIEAV
ncbi:MAG: hypothetical protein ABSG65_30230 [Bryobacteraceae bacterium]